MIEVYLWKMFQLVELTGIVRQQGDMNFIQILNKVRVGNIDKDTEKMLKASRIDKDSKNFPYDKFYIFAENEQ